MAERGDPSAVPGARTRLLPGAAAGCPSSPNAPAHSSEPAAGAGGHAGRRRRTTPRRRPDAGRALCVRGDGRRIHLCGPAGRRPGNHPMARTADTGATAAPSAPGNLLPDARARDRGHGRRPARPPPADPLPRRRVPATRRCGALPGGGQRPRPAARCPGRVWPGPGRQTLRSIGARATVLDAPAGVSGPSSAAKGVRLPPRRRSARPSRGRNASLGDDRGSARARRAMGTCSGRYDTTRRGRARSPRRRAGTRGPDHRGRYEG